MDQLCCGECGSPLRSSESSNEQRRCTNCLYRKRIASVLTDEHLDHLFSKRWSKRLLRALGVFLEKHEVALGTQVRMLSKATHIFQEADRCFRWPEEMKQEWLEEMIEKAGPHLAPTFFKAFLLEEKMLTAPSKDEEKINVLRSKLESVPQHYRRLMEVYFNERISLRERQVKEQARRPLAVSTMMADWGLLSRLIRWLTEQVPDLKGWDMVQEEHIHAFLLTLTPKTRELARKDLHMFFRLARKRRIITHVPIMDYPSKALPRTIEPLRGEAQKGLAQLIRESIYAHPEEAFLTALCFYHALSPVQICHLRTSDVDVQRGMMHVEGRPPVYLLAEDVLLLEQFLRKRQDLPYAKKRSYLFISNQAILDDQALGKEYVARKVRAFAGQTPQCLRITCLTTLSALYGPHYLVEAFGLSLTQASRYGNMQEFLLEEEVKQQREAFLELSRQLGQDPKPRPPRSQKRET